MPKNQTQETKITVICWNCDRKFSFLLSTIQKKRVTFLGDDDAELGSKLVWPKAYGVPCPYCGKENEVMLPS
jgi:DNA-directed RNA polymerase subunit RPC12/RpoP